MHRPSEETGECPAVVTDWQNQPVYAPDPFNPALHRQARAIGQKHDLCRHALVRRAPGRSPRRPPPVGDECGRGPPRLSPQCRRTAGPHRAPGPFFLTRQGPPQRSPEAAGARRIDKCRGHGSTVAFRPLPPRAAGERDWQARRRTRRNPTLPLPAAGGGRQRKGGMMRAAAY